jgi:hypothetical protein
MVFESERRNSLFYEGFRENYLPLKPVMVRDVPRHWKALGRWTPEFFEPFMDRVLESTDENPQSLASELSWRLGILARPRTAKKGK